MYDENPKILNDYIGIAVAVCPATHHLTHNQATRIEKERENLTKI
jgi:hypothetical protein